MEFDRRSSPRPLETHMIVDTALEVSAMTPSQPNLSAFSWLSAWKYRAVIVFSVFLGLVVLLQVLSGAYHAEFGGYPDEPAHYVTSLMLRNYILDFKMVSPMSFAQAYYDHYPKVAFGHWPPVFYIVQGCWMLIFSPSRASVRLELAFTTALLAYAIYGEIRRRFGEKAGWLAGLLTVCLPMIQTYSDQEMAESLLVLLCFWSAIFFARYLEAERWQDCVWFSIFFSLAVLTKGSGWLLALVPPIAMVLTRKLRLLLRPPIWVAGLIVGALCIPWQLMTMHLVQQGWTGGITPSIEYTVSALGQFLVVFEQIGGPVLALLTLIGIFVLVLRPAMKGAVAGYPSGMFAFILAVWLFHSIVPAGVEERKMVIAIPAAMLFLFAGGFYVAEKLPLRGHLKHWRTPLVTATAAVMFFATAFYIPFDRHFGYTEAARFITSDATLRKETILVSSGSIGEGLLISEIAMRAPNPTDIIIRGTKALAKVNWNASQYESVFSTPRQVVNYLDTEKVQLVVMDDLDTASHFAHNELLRQAIDKSGRFHLLATFSPDGSRMPGAVRLYEFTSKSQNRGEL